ncbi:MAG: two-component regulator propeller domain-containing protein [Bacteroides sp.]|nr:two-component regulator propeller domain-containing protein [Bacteroides sp.]
MILRSLLILLSIVTSALYGQNITFNHLTTSDGLSQFSVNSLYIDENGAVWIGTREGLNRYNGEDIQTYKLKKNDPNSLFCNNVLHIVGDQKGKIYLLCTEGVAEMDLRTQKFTTLLQGNIHSIYYNDGLFIGQKNEIYRFNEETDHFDLYYRLADSNLEIFCMLKDDTSLWIGTTSAGVFRLNLKEKNEPDHLIPDGNITSIYQDSKEDIWIGSWERGLYHIGKDGNVENLRHDAGNPRSISSDFVRTCCEDDLGNIWIGTFNGLNRYDKTTRTFQNHTEKEEQREGLTHSSIWCIVKDSQGTLWLGTYFGGVNYFNPEYEIYTHYAYLPTEKDGLSYPVVGRTVEDKEGNLWIGTEGGGLNYYNRKTHEFKWYRPTNNNPNSLSHNNVKALYYDARKNVIWVGTHLGGINRLDIRSGRFTHYRMDANNPQSLPSDIIRDIIPYGDSLIVATQNGVCMFNPTDGKCRQLFKDSEEGRSIKMVAKVTFDRNGNLWIAATGEGVFKYRFDTHKLTNYRHDPNLAGSLSNNNINNITQDSKGNLWFSTSGSGLDLYHPETDNFENFDQATNGLASNCVYDAQESPISGKLMLSTNQGFSIFDQQQKQSQNYSTENGFPLTAINENALCITHDGEIFLGGIQGMISFHETDLNFTPKPYKINLSRLIVGGAEVQVGDETGILQQSLAYTREITLNAHQNMFSIEFATSNYVLANKDDILYQLKGFSSDWNKTQGLHRITYTNLDAGTYHLVIKPAKKGKAICAPVELTIHVKPPYYKTTVAYLAYAVCIGTLLWYLVRTYQSRIRLRESLKYEQKHIRDVEALNQSKLRFFTNISHEFRTPLTLIVAQVETLLQVQNFTPHIYNKVLSIYKNSIQLRELITELLDFRKQEQGHMKIKVSPHNIVNFLYENYLLFLEYANVKQIHFNFEKEADSLEVWYDQKQMQKVINNLISNALKHTKAEDTITLGIKTEGSNAVIRVSDTGTGIDAKETDKIFDRFYQIDPVDSKDATKAGTGIGLALTKGIVELHHGCIRVESELGKGTSFIVNLPLGNASFSEEEISRQTEDESQTVNIVQQQEMDTMLKAELEDTAPLKHLPDAKMLIVEDNASIREMLANIFKPFYQVLTASDGEEGLELVRKEMPHIVVSDVVMPRMSGTELCKQIKGDFNICHIPVVLLTARTAVEQNIEGLRIGADDYITKPFHTNLLISRCNNLVNSRILLQEKFSKQPQAAVQMLATNPLDQDMLNRAMTIIENHLDDVEFNVNTFAREMGMARTNLFAKLKAITGQTPNDFILTIRLKKGALMLRNNLELNITEISDRIGFSSSRYFSKCFKDVYHVSPMAYRKGENDGENEEEKEKEKTESP